jgi:hypothetical protein
LGLNNLKNGVLKVFYCGAFSQIVGKLEARNLGIAGPVEFEAVQGYILRG